MMTTPLTTKSSALTSEANTPAAKDPNEKSKDDFINLLLSLCGAPPLPPVATPPAESAGDNSTSPVANTPQLDQTAMPVSSLPLATTAPVTPTIQLADS